MQPLTRERLAANAYRTLGLSADASQEAIDQAARKMRIWPDPARIPPTVWDLPALGKPARSKNDLEQAVSRLNEPQSRVEERLLWFHTDAARKAGPSPEALDSACHALAAAPDPAARHDAALAALHAALLLDPLVKDESRWHRALVGFGTLSGSDDYRDWLYRAESDGDFEKRAEFSEIDAALKALPDSIAGSLIAKADEALAHDDLEGCSRVLRLLGVAGNVALQYRVLDRIEDALERRCNQLDDDMKARLQCDRDRYSENMAANRQVCLDAAMFYNDAISPIMTELDSLAAGDGDRTLRSRGMGAKALARVALGWVWAGDYVTAERTYVAALDMARGTALEAPIRSDMEENAARAQRQRMGMAAATAVQPRRVLPYTTPARSSSRTSTGGWTLGGVGVAVLVVRLLVALGSGFNSNNTRYTPPPVPTYTAPRYYPTTPTPRYPATPGYPGNPNPGNPNYPPNPNYPRNPNDPGNSDDPGNSNGRANPNAPENPRYPAPGYPRQNPSYPSNPGYPSGPRSPSYPGGGGGGFGGGGGRR
ncbi:MAG: hypothetical protein JWO87_831 [Phycisphaerales bacterium]|nr:hypothetical protein [Phycisphaerales bacterium]